METFKIHINHPHAIRMKRVIQNVKNIQTYANSKGYELILDQNSAKVVGFVATSQKKVEPTEIDFLKKYNVFKKADLTVLMFSEQKEGFELSEKVNNMGPIIFDPKIDGFNFFVKFNKIAYTTGYIYFESSHDFERLKDFGFEKIDRMAYLLAKSNNEVKFKNVFYFDI